MRSASFVLAGILLLAFAQPVEAQTPRIGYIDSQAILQEAPGAQEAQQEFERNMQGYQEEIQQMGEELERLIEQYQQQERTLSPEARQRREEEIRQKEMQYQQRVEEMEMEAADRRQQLVEPILDRMSGAIEQIRSEGQYTMIFDVASRAIIAADPELDLTTQVLQRLRETAGNEDR
jgi:outer membrane protein